MAGTRKRAVQQVTVHLTSEEVEFLRTQAGIDGVSFNDVLRRSINPGEVLRGSTKEKRKIFFGAPGQPLREMIGQ